MGQVYNNLSGTTKNEFDIGKKPNVRLKKAGIDLLEFRNNNDQLISVAAKDITISTGAAGGKVLVSDANGKGTWQYFVPEQGWFGPKDACRVATTTSLVASAYSALELTASVTGAISLDGVPLALNDRVLVKDGVNVAGAGVSNVYNGIYYVTAVGDGSNPWKLKRAVDFDGSPLGEVSTGNYTFVIEGTDNGKKAYAVSNVGSITIDTTAITFVLCTVAVSYGTADPLMDGIASPGTESNASRSDHRHPTDTSRAPLDSPTFTGIPAAATAAADTNTTQLATTAYVIGQAGTVTPLGNSVGGTLGSSLRYARENHQHPWASAGGDLAGTYPNPTIGMAVRPYLGVARVVRVATTANLASLSGLLVIDTVQTVAGDRVLVKNQDTASLNGIYVVSSGVWSYAPDWATGAVVPQLTVRVSEGATNYDTQWGIITTGAITVGTTSVIFDQKGGFGTGNILRAEYSSYAVVANPGTAYVLYYSFTTKPVFAGTYRFAWSYEYYSLSTSTSFDGRITIDGTIYQSLSVTPRLASDTLANSGYKYLVFTGGLETHTIALNIKRSGNGTVGCNRVDFEFWQIL